LTNANDNVTCFIPFSKTTSATSNQLFIDNVTSPLTYNPNTGSINCNNVTCTTISCATTTTDVRLPVTVNAISFNGNILTINGSDLSIRKFNWVLGGTSNIMIGLVINGHRINADYTIGILNNGTDTLTINKVLGGNNRTRFTSDVIVPIGGYAVINIQVLSINSATMTIVDAYNVA
jgi:hypothetical protein